MSDHTDRTNSLQFIPLGVIGTGKAAVLKTYVAGRLQAARAFQLDNKSGDSTQEQFHRAKREWRRTRDAALRERFDSTDVENNTKEETNV